MIFFAAFLLAPIPTAALAQEAALAKADEPALVSQAQLESWTAEILEDIEEMRGAQFLRKVSVAVADGATFRKYAAERMEKSTTPELARAEETLAKMLGLIPAELDYMGKIAEMLDAQVGGFYDPETEGFWLMDRFGGDIARTILAHELTHALDDQLFDIDGTLEGIGGNGDAEFAYHAVVEGSGTVLMNGWTMAHVTELNLAELMENDTMGMDALEDLPSFIWKPMIAVYFRGAAFLNRTDNAMVGSQLMPEVADLNRAFANPPLSSEQILHPEKYWDADRRDDPVVLSLDTSRLPAGWRVIDEDTLGEFAWGQVIQPAGDRGGLSNPFAVMTLSYTYPASEGWGGDRFVLLGKDDARVLVAHSVWDTERDADEFERAIAKLEPHLNEAILGTAQNANLEGSGQARWRGVEGDSKHVALRLWIGVSDEEAERVWSSLTVRTE